MDAKPQRPLRSFKVRDENVPPPGLAAKTVHQRNKSSPALSTLAHQHGALKAAPRRTAFADVSNTNRGNYVVKDDSAISAAKYALADIKELPTQENQRPTATAFPRPTQRPLSVSGIKGFLINSLSSGASTAADRNKTSTETSLNSRKPLPKPPIVKTMPLEIAPLSLSSLPAPNAQVEEAAIPSYPAGDRLYQPDPILPAHVDTMSRPYSSTSYQSHSSKHELPPLPPSSSDNYDIRSDGVRLDQGYDVAKSQIFHHQHHPVDDDSHLYADAVPYILADSEIPPLVEDNPIDKVILPNYKQSKTPQVGFGDQWEDQAYGEKYDDYDYGTVRSLKSRGDSTTTGQTTVILAPKVTSKVEQEIAAARKYVQENKTLDEIEEDETWDTSMVAEYSEEIFEYMKTLEERMRPNPYYMDNQTEVQWSMRSVLMDWIVQVHHRFALLPETLFLCVNYIDRFLSCKVVSLGKLQLVGATAIFIAAKYEEINCPSVNEIQYMVDGGYTVEEILKAERFMLSMLQFELGWPGPMSFLRRVSKADDYDLETRTLAKYFLEITVMDERFVGCVPSFTAAGAHCLARLMLGKGSWSQAHVYYSNYTYSQLWQLMSTMLSCCEDPQKHHCAIFDKYGDKRFKRASYFVQSEMSKGFTLPPVSSRLSLGQGFGGEGEWNNGSANCGLKSRTNQNEQNEFYAYLYGSKAYA